MRPEILLRPAVSEDVPEIATLYAAARAAAVPLMPPAVHTPEEDLAHFAGLVADHAREVWVADTGTEVVAFIVLTQTWIDDLFVRPDHQREGIGHALVALATSLRPDGLGLHVFETNLPAQRLYAAHGFVVTERSDGSDNEERAPDLRMEWSGAR